MSPPISPTSNEIQIAMRQSSKQNQRKRKSDAYLSDSKAQKEVDNSDTGGASNQAETIFSAKTIKSNLVAQMEEIDENPQAQARKRPPKGKRN